MPGTWGKEARDEYFYETKLDEDIESEYERAYQAQCKRELALWERRRRNADHKSNPRT